MKTNQLFLVLIMLFTAFYPGLAQEVNLGVKAGGNYSTLKEIEGGETDHLPGFHVGLTAEISLSPTFSLQPELLYSLEGVKADFNYSIGGATFSLDQKIKLGYINLPVMAKYFVTPAFSLQAGPQAGYLVSARNEYESKSKLPGEAQVNESGEDDIKDSLKKISLGLNLGLGYNFQNNLFIQARYHMGLSDISDYEDEMGEDFEGELEKIKNSGFQVSLGYRF